LRTPFSVLRSGPSTAQNLDKDGVLHVQAVSDHPRKRPESLKKVLMSKPVQNSMNGEMAALDTAKALIESM